MSSSHSSIPGMGPRKGREEALTQGMKINRKHYLPVIEQGDALSFYVEGRNEPVPPDPAIISNVKYTYVSPLPPKSIPKSATPGTPVPTSRPPSMNWFKGPKLDRDILAPSHSLAKELYKPSVKVIKNPAAAPESEEIRSEVASSSSNASNSSNFGESKSSSLTWLKPTKNDFKEENKEEASARMNSSLKASSSKNASNSDVKSSFGETKSSSLAWLKPTKNDFKEENKEKASASMNSSLKASSSNTASNSDVKSSFGETKGSSLTWLKPTKNDSKEENKEDASARMNSSLKVFLEVDHEEQEVRVMKQLSSHEFLVNLCDHLSFEKLVSLEKNMFSSLGPKALPAKSVEPNMFYTLRPQKSIAKVCYRVKILKVLTYDMAHVFTIDHGNYHIVPTANLFPLEPEWTSLPQQACYIRTNQNYAEAMNEKIIIVRPLHDSCVDFKVRAPPESLNEVITVRGYQVLVTVA